MKLAVATGVAGISIEDSTGDKAHPLHDFDLAVERIRAARQAIDESGTGVVLTGRSEGFVVGRPDIDETIRQAACLRRGGGRLPLRAADRNRRACCGDRHRGRTEAGEPSDQRAVHDSR